MNWQSACGFTLDRFIWMPEVEVAWLKELFEAAARPSRVRSPRSTFEPPPVLLSDKGYEPGPDIAAWAPVILYCELGVSWLLILFALL